MTRRRVVVTGIGLVSPLGEGVETNWDQLLAGEVDAGIVPTFNPELYMPHKDIKKLGKFAQYATAAAVEAIQDADFNPNPEYRERMAVVIGTSVGGAEVIENTVTKVVQAGGDTSHVSPFYIVSHMPNAAAGYIAMRYSIEGPNITVATACASGCHAIGTAYRMIQYGDADSALAGGTEATITPLTNAAFGVMGALSKSGVMRPFDLNRDGIIISDGAGVVVLEELSAAKQRGAMIYAEIVGYGMSGDAHAMAAPPEDGSGAVRAMSRALADAGLDERHVDYINAHGTATPLGDRAETAAIKKVFGGHAKKLLVSSTKSMTGHMLGAAGGYEAAITAMALRDGIVPPTINYLTSDPECDLDYVTDGARPLDMRFAMSNSFGFGGTNGCLVLRRY